VFTYQLLRLSAVLQGCRTCCGMLCPGLGTTGHTDDAQVSLPTKYEAAVRCRRPCCCSTHIDRCHTIEGTLQRQGPRCAVMRQANSACQAAATSSAHRPLASTAAGCVCGQPYEHEVPTGAMDKSRTCGIQKHPDCTCIRQQQHHWLALTQGRHLGCP